MKKGWETVTLEEVCEFQDRRGVTPEKLGSRFVSEGFRVISAKNIKGGQIDISIGEQRFVDEPTYRKWMKSPLLADDVVLTSEAPLGEPAYVTEELLWCLGQRLFGITSDKSKLYGKFLFYALQASPVRDDLLSRATGATAQGVRQAELRRVGLPLPPLAEQQRIVGVLDEAFAGLATAQANAEKNLQNARALFESHLQSVFTQRGKGWVEAQLAEVCERLHQGLNTAGEKVKFYDSGYPIIQTRNIDNGVIELGSKIKFMCEADWKVYRDKYRPEVGDVFFTNIGTIGKTAIVTFDLDYLIHWNIFKLRPRLEKITSEFLRYTLEQLTLSGYFAKLQKGGTVDFVTKKMISEALIYLPSIAEQKRIIATLDDLRTETQRLETLYTQKQAALAALKKSLLHDAFRGAL